MSNLLARYPAYLQRGAEFADIQQALETEVLALRQARDETMEQLNVDTATWSLKYWEQALGIPVEISKDIDLRRSRVKSKLRGAGVTTGDMIQNVAESFSNGAVEVTELSEQYRVAIKFVGNIGTPPNMDDLTAALREIMPAHLGWDYVIIYKTWDGVKKNAWNELSAYTWQQVKESDLNG
ncbi:putative phage tail protein [Oscillibacter sp.]|uniref:putative phage tail protein n=1 Tax=Oscillibacter sp. TaxID=1945593 RepID=UPI0028A58F49|nr:putative phage tail protein [Oscillibacter sp.]